MTHNNQSPAVNHLAKFIDEEFVVGAKGHVQISAFLKAYEWWTLSRGVVHRRLTPVELFDRVKRDFGIEPGKVRFVVDDHERFVYALQGISFKNDPSLSWRLKYRSTPRESSRQREPSDEVESERETSAQEKRRAYYIANRERILAKKRKRKGAE